MIRKLLISTLLGFMAWAVSAQGFAQDDVNEKRQKLMKGQSAASKAIKAAASSKDYATIEAKAKDLMGSAAMIVSSFPAGSSTGKTKAKSAIWKKSDEFANDAKQLGKVAGELAAAAKAGNDGEIAVKMKEIGAACSSCHKAFRAKNYSK